MKTLLAKLMIALLATALLSLVTVIIITRINLRNGFVEFLERQESRQLNNLVPVLAEIYQQNDGWTSLIANEQNWYRLFDFSRSRGAGSDPRLRRPGRPPDRARAPPNGDGSFGRPPGPRPSRPQGQGAEAARSASFPFSDRGYALGRPSWTFIS